MGVCSAKDNPHVQQRVRQAIHPSKTFQLGEIFYLKHSHVNPDSNNVAGGKEKVELSFSISENLSNATLTDLKLEVLISGPTGQNNFIDLGRTEGLEPNSTKFNVVFVVDYFFERHQNLKVQLKMGGKAVGQIETTLGNIVGSRGMNKDFPVVFLNTNISINIASKYRKEELKNSVVYFDISIDRKTYGSYFIIISNFKENGLQRVYKSREVVSIDPKFVIPELNLFDLCSGNLSNDLLFELYETTSGKVGSLRKSLTALNEYNDKPIEIVSEHNQTVGAAKICYRISEVKKFLDLIYDGLQISVICGVDFTASNGNYNDATSLHYIRGGEPNSYEQALRACCSVVAYYDYDQMFPVLGFGAKLQNGTSANHCFNCTLTNEPNVFGVEGIVNAYKNALINVQLDGPTYFYPLIKSCVDLVRNQTVDINNKSYHILLIITDGMIHDMQATKDIIFEAAQLPISIIIIGIGNNPDFDNMVELDGDTVPLSNSRGQRVVRDIVQFVKYDQLKMDVTKLAGEVLFEVPGQVEQYFIMKGG